MQSQNKIEMMMMMMITWREMIGGQACSVLRQVERCHSTVKMLLESFLCLVCYDKFFGSLVLSQNMNNNIHSFAIYGANVEKS